VVAGRVQQLSSPLIVEGGEVLAPVAPALRLLGMTVKQNNGVITLTAPDARTLKLKENSTVAEADGRKFAVGAAPRQVDDELYLPVVTLAPYLDAFARYRSDENTLTLLPLLHITCTERADGSVVVQARSVASIQYTSGWLKNPPRAYFDFKNAALGNDESQFTPRSGGVERVRISQYSTTPDVVRVVADCDAVRGVDASVSELGRLATIIIGAEIPAPEQTVPVPENPPAIPTRLTDAVLESLSPQQSQLTLTADGAPPLESSYNEKTRQLVMQLGNTVSAISPARLKGLGNRLVTSVAVESPAGDTGTRVTVTLKRAAGYLINRDAAGIHVLIGSFNMDDMLIVLDAGHGGGDTGAVGANGTLEKDINLDIIQRAGKLLNAAGCRVLLTRNDDTLPALDDRPGLANSRQADIFISVHCNSSATRNTGSGTQVYFKTPQSIPLAAIMHEELIKALELRDGGIRTARFVVIRKSLMPAVLLEIAFINNEKEEQLLCTPAFRQKAAEAILNGVRRYASSNAWKLRRSDLTTIFAAAPPVEVPAK